MSSTTGKLRYATARLLGPALSSGFSCGTGWRVGAPWSCIRRLAVRTQRAIEVERVLLEAALEAEAARVGAPGWSAWLTAHNPG